ncbi:putative membrane protein [Halarsenatibacter silvermanii]|uniref:Putative membrane protein n=2 Tax=Halarsenatibacter silvermanii TaxID=321763 RepID=A0A1G9HYI4_9FIRM|nr:putative membrane protein [Halarsenatibacter silvermanii]
MDETEGMKPQDDPASSSGENPEENKNAGARPGWLRLFLEGLPFGVANTLPGMSGGTVALIFYIYEPLLLAIKNLDLLFLIPLGAGAGLGALLGATVIDRVFDLYPDLLMALLAGMILASLRVTWHEARRDFSGGRIKIINPLLAVLGIILALFLTGEGETEAAASLLMIFGASILGSVTMLLPGISGASLFVVLGVYRQIITAIAELQFLVLLVYGLGTVVGLLVFAWLLSWLIRRYRRQLMFLLSGLILGSVAGVIPTSPGFPELISFVIGFAAVFRLISWTRRRH